MSLDRDNTFSVLLTKQDQLDEPEEKRTKCEEQNYMQQNESASMYAKTKCISK